MAEWQISKGGGCTLDFKISSYRDDRMGAKIKPPKKSLDQKLIPKKSHAKFFEP